MSKPTAKTKYIKTNHNHTTGTSHTHSLMTNSTPTVLRLEKGHFDFLVSVETENTDRQQA